jgi:hypothetical protein
MSITRKTLGRIGMGNWVMVCLLFWSYPGRGEGLRWVWVGGRGGIPANQGCRNFNLAQVFGTWHLPLEWSLGKGWDVQGRLDLSGGWLGDRKYNAVIGSVGPSLELHRQRCPLSLTAGVSPTYISRHDFELRDFGAAIQFTCHAGLNLDLARHWRLGYRWQHMSNAGLAAPNPGLNLHVFGVSFRF